MTFKFNKKMALFLLPTLSLLGITGVSLYYAGYKINTTESYPTGIYKVDTNKKADRGAMVLVCPPKNRIFLEAKERGYLGDGICEGGITPLLKKIAGLPGDKIVVSNGLVYINGILQKNSDVFEKDGRNRPLKIYPGGVVKEGEIFIMSDYNKMSFDSRYFGVVPSENIIGHSKPVILF